MPTRRVQTPVFNPPPDEKRSIGSDEAAQALFRVAKNLNLKDMPKGGMIPSFAPPRWI